MRQNFNILPCLLRFWVWENLHLQKFWPKNEKKTQVFNYAINKYTSIEMKYLNIWKIPNKLPAAIFKIKMPAGF